MDDADVFVSREELYAMVWTTPMQKLAKEFGISDVAIAKTCKKLGVPRPPRGYWARKAAGQIVKATPLPIKGAKQRGGVYLSRRKKPKPVAQLSESTVELIGQLKRPENLILMQDSLAEPHRLVRITKRALTRCKTDVYGALWSREVCLNLRVSKQSLKRSLLIMDTLFKHLEKLGYDVTLTKSGETVVMKGEIAMKLALYERFNRFEQVLNEKQKLNAWRYDKYRFEPSGEFDITLSRWPLHDRHWKDTPKRRLENRLTDILVEIVSSTDLVKVESDRREAERLQWIELQRLEAERLQREVEEKRRREELEDQASAWRRAADLRLFLNACEAELASQTSSYPERAITKWLRWAHQHANRMDPTRNGYLDKLFASDLST